MLVSVHIQRMQKEDPNAPVKRSYGRGNPVNSRPTGTQLRSSHRLRSNLCLMPAVVYEPHYRRVKAHPQVPAAVVIPTSGPLTHTGLHVWEKTQVLSHGSEQYPKSCLNPP